MKIWFKLLFGAIIGIILGIFLPANGGTTLDFLKQFSDTIIRIGRYALFPLLFFSLATGIFKLRENKKTVRVYLRTIIYMILFSAVLTIIGALTVLLLSPARIPIIIEQGAPLEVKNLAQYIEALLPLNFFSIFNSQGNFLLPIFGGALIIGLNLNFDKQITMPAIDFFDAMSRIFSRINDLIVEVMGFGMIVLGSYLTMQIRVTPSLELFRQLLLVLSADFILIVFGLFPAMLYLLTPGKENPYKWLYSTIAPAISAFLSGDNFFALPYLIKTGHDNLGIPRRVGSTTFPLFAIFGKAGTGLVTAVSFVVILKSYSSLGITINGIIWVIGVSFLLSFLTGNYPAAGFLVAISFMCTLYGQGLEEGYLILTPIIPLLISFSVILNTISSAVASFLIAEHEDMRKDVEVENYI
ncbi:MAG: dicarboxylate/amino acid:cation symporter [Spirochaetales bacterium]|nr:dicarboxylate/amino acid:cation symporter [Spirochaetales bacterium]